MGFADAEALNVVAAQLGEQRMLADGLDPFCQCFQIHTVPP